MWRRKKTAHVKMDSECACWLVGLLVCSALQASQARALQKIHATVPYAISGKQTVLGPDGATGKYAIGGQVVFYHSLLTDKGDQIGHLAGHCHIVSQQGPKQYVSVCTKHYDWLDGSTMTAHATEIIGPDNNPIKGRLVIAGGIGRWEGAHGEDINYMYDPASGKGSGKIVLYCLKGVC
eukprot:GHUV01003328.1.p1 GENE.GHUV01003328.1~~GHUV01003328.1.p1  ORF type:complete len:179 (+),score=19.76 GHUV01003328.1:411-947(+)